MSDQESLLSFYYENGIAFYERPQEGISSLEALREALLNFEGCLLKATAIQLVFSDGNPKAPLMLIGEAPGAEEDQQGLPFVGRSGQLLDKMLKSIGLDRTKDCYIANVVPWRPPGNRPPSQEEIAACLPFLKKHIALVKPKLLVLLGGVATKTILNTKEGIVKVRGRVSFYEGVPVIPTFHPSYLLRSPTQKATAWKDWLFVKKTLKKII